MMGFSTCTVLGNLTRNPELKYTQSGTPVANLSLAVNRKFKQGDEMREEVDYLDVVVFGRTAENVTQYTSKGSAILAHGRLQQRRWETPEGQKRSKVEVVAEKVQFLSKGPGSNGQNQESHDEEYTYGEY